MALYPPIVASSMPAFNINEGSVKVYFTLSPYNTTNLANITAQVSVRRQSSNVSVLQYSSEVLNKNIDTQSQTDRILNRYSVTIENSDIYNRGTESTGFITDVIYKVQIRLCERTIDENNSVGDLFSNNINAFSQWSTVCLIKGITPPTFYIDQFNVDGVEPDESDENTFTYDLADFTGVYKTNQTSSQTLKYWRLRLLKDSYTEENILDIDEYTYADSGFKAVSAYNYTLDSNSMVLECSLPYDFYSASIAEEKIVDYKLLFEIVTKNDYQDSILYHFTYSKADLSEQTGADLNNSIFETYVNEEQGYIKLFLDLNIENSALSNYVFRRTDSKSNFTKWEDIYNFTLGGSNNIKEYYDFTAQSGLLYQYCVQFRDIRGRRANPRKSQIIVAQWQHSYLLESNLNGSVEDVKQLKLKYDFQISSYKTNIAENKTDTIGSKYPYIRRNGDVYYRSFPCSGTITCLSDNANLFVTKNNMFENYRVKYNQLRGFDEEYPLSSSQYDYTQERKFREYVEQFLYNVKPKLYKSCQEGNILIKLMDVSLTPKTQLGRLVYSFSATAYQIGEPSIQNFNYYNIIKIGYYDTLLSEWKSHMEQDYFKNNQGKWELQTYKDYDWLQQITSINSVEDYRNENRERKRLDTDSREQVFTPQGFVYKAGQDIIGTDTTAAATSISQFSVARINNYGVLDQDNRIVKKIKFKWIRLQVESEPYLIISDQQGNLVPVDDIKDQYDNDDRYEFTSPKIRKKLYQMESTYQHFETDNEQNVTESIVDYYLGTLFDINGKRILISYPNNIYEIKEQNIQNISNLKIVPVKDTALTLNYVIQIYDQKDPSTVAKIIKSNKINAQLEDKFEPFKDIVDNIKLLYRQELSDGEGRVVHTLQGIKSIKIDADPGVTFLIYTQKNSFNQAPQVVPQLVTINDSGEIEYDLTDLDDVYVKSLSFLGYRIPKERTKNTELSISSDDAIDFNIDETNNYIYYKNKWHQIINNKQILLYDNDRASYDDFIYFKYPINALIYYYAIEKEAYY